jgi:NAD(P)H-dependent flavin oxidoreductase YrpB (nitropropane dioxygenase family)
VLKTMLEGVNHLGGDEHTAEVDPDREFMPAGQGAGAITALVPAGELVTRFVAEAEAALARAGTAAASN